MNKSKEENNKDIKPVRSEAASNRGQRRIKGLKSGNKNLMKNKK